MPRPKPSKYRGPKLADLEIDHLYPPERMAGILKLFTPPQVPDRERVEIVIKRTASELNACLKARREAPTERQMKGALVRAAEIGTSFTSALADLDPSSAREIRKAAAQDKRRPDENPLLTNHAESLGRYRYERARESLADLLDCIATAVSNLNQSGPGRHAFDAELESAEGLRDLWLEWTPQLIGTNGKLQKANPKLRDFHAFFQAAVMPVYEQYGLSPNLKGVCERVL